ncbi:hypothetical protein [Bosea sp. AS-1]|uniref:hypothetical protein n=1 Tax=Bosea sp. AS-1 TaxID=2015316 RepID=UPI000B7735BA|nr:hypothetical protein [Bosea sp. AS-1]
MSETSFSEDVGALLDDLIDRLKSRAVKVARSALLSLSAVVVATSQTFFDYSAWRVGLIVFLLSSFRHTSWLAVAILAWLVVLYFAPPDIASRIAIVAAATK